jgi:hypothetical protein
MARKSLPTMDESFRILRTCDDVDGETDFKVQPGPEFKFILNW